MDEESEFLVTEHRMVDDTRIERFVLDRPEKANAVTNETITMLASNIEALDHDDADVVELVGEGGTFCSGADLAMFRTNGVDEKGESAAAHAIESVTGLQRVVDALRECPLPVVAAVMGRAVGAGMHLCLGADIVLAAEDATFAAPEATLGMPAGGYLPTLLSTVVGEQVAREWLLTGNEVDAATAADAGFVSRVVPADDLDSVLDEYVMTLAGNSAFAIAELKARLADPELRSNQAALQQAECEAMDRAFRDGDAIERIDRLFNS